jgi:hypothetical protein
MRSRLDDVPPWGGVLRALERDLCGIGGRLPRPPEDLDEAVVRTEQMYGERAAARLRRWSQVSVGAAVWTRDDRGEMHRGILTGPWRYDASAAAHAVDLVHVRSCTWHRVAPDDVPAAVQETFRRGGRNFQRITRL